MKPRLQSSSWSLNENFEMANNKTRPHLQILDQNIIYNKKNHYQSSSRTLLYHQEEVCYSFKRKDVRLLQRSLLYTSFFILLEQHDVNITRSIMFGGAFEDAQQFNGGGFMPSPDAQQGKETGTKKSYDTQSQSVRRLTIKQLSESIGQNSDGLVVDGKEVSNIALVGKMSNVKEDQVIFTMVLDDGTGTVLVKMYINNDGNEDMERDQRGQLKDGMYVRVFGHVTQYNNETSINAFSIRPITDFNEITYHLSQVIFQHLHLTKGTTPQGGSGAATAQTGGAGMQQQVVHQQVGGMAPVDTEVLNIFNSMDTSGNEAGMGVAEVIAHSNNRLDQSTVMAAIHRLVEDGHLYSTIDDAHWKSCSLDA